jgi:coenzyme F420-dependent glucose-6-phosphate dehydrogenase
MGVIDSVRGVLWARGRQPGEPAYIASLAHERFTPAELLQQAVAAEHAGFDAVCCSDHLTPWWAPGTTAPAACGNAWVWLGAAGSATDRVGLGTGVTSIVHRYNPVVVAQQVATMASMFPGRSFLGVGTGEAMNEVPAGLHWPPPSEQLARAEEALEIITRLLDGDIVDFDGRYFRTVGARLHLRPEQRPPLFMSAFGPEAARLAGRYADGVWTLADPQKAPTVIAAYREACEEANRPAGEIILQTMVSWADDDDAALAGAREWKPTLVDSNYAADVHDPARIGATDDEVSDTRFKAMGIISSDPATHVRKLKAIAALGATAVVTMNISGADPVGTIETYGSSVLPRLRG